MRAFLLFVLCLVAVAAEAQQPCPGGKCRPVDAYQFSRGPAFGKRVAWQAGQSRGSLRVGPFGLWKKYEYHR